jgi:hypothetical protein
MRTAIPARSGTWTSLNGDLRVAEVVSVGFDPLNNTYFSGTQDNGSNLQVPVRLQGAPNITFAAVADPSPDTLTRSAGSWIADGFVTGMRIRIGGAGANNGDFTVGNVTDLVLTLAAGETLANAAAAGGVTVVQLFSTPIDSDGDGVPDDFSARSQWATLSAPFNAAGFGFPPFVYTGDGNTTVAIPIDTNADGDVRSDHPFRHGQ